MIHVETPGLLTTVQDLGRWGHQHLGLAPGGAMDVDAARIANLLAGNDPGAAALEITLAGPRLVLESGAWIAWTGAPSIITLNEVDLPGWRPVWAPAGSRLRWGGLYRGCRGYLAVGGGIAVPLVLGSRSTDLRAGIGGLAGRALQVAVGDRQVHVPGINQLAIPRRQSGIVLDRDRVVVGHVRHDPATP